MSRRRDNTAINRNGITRRGTKLQISRAAARVVIAIAVVSVVTITLIITFV